MMLLPLYAVITWYFCFRYRRKLVGWCALAMSLLVIATAMVLEQRIRTWLRAGDNPFTSLQFILWGELIIVGVGGAFILCLRQGGAEVPCRKCGYELAGLEVENPQCPECGELHAAYRPDRPIPTHVRSAQRRRSQYKVPSSATPIAGPAITPILQR